MSPTLFALGTIGWVLALANAAMSLILWRALVLEQHENDDLIQTIAVLKKRHELDMDNLADDYRYAADDAQ